ncbi:NTF2-like N-terminal transpeptidase domain-containing protein [Speluncibacter jeojiensis]|uniref:Penicillin-binding protein n=1 Tax=Speluncibacter jeojiensis TaxID=2710754 RepID=A0A9X4LXC2_9ACTN|nr:NTF2-like N-terminal transpeptidase domain-containing protein [Rhodococcus sp. D2-41]MDG3014085.1 penicillin-binding protein [Corynebacteriales bacterium D3-21]
MHRLARRVGSAVPPAALLVIAMLAVTLTACGSGTSTSQQAVADFVSALNRHDVKAAAAMTDTPSAAQPVIQQLIDGLAPKNTNYQVEQVAPTGGNTGSFSLSADWDFGQGRQWKYTTDGQLTQLSIGWRVSWSPQVLAPSLAPGDTVHEVRTDAAAPKVLDRTNAPILTEQTINKVLLDPAHMPDPVASTTELANILVPVAPLITAQSLQQELADSKGKPITAVSLRDGDFAILGDRIRAVPGVVVQQGPQLIPVSGILSSPALDGVKTYWQQSRDATAGWAVLINHQNGSVSQVAGFQGPPPPDVPTTLDSPLQFAAENAVASVGTPAVLVAMQPSTGAILAVAQNNQADAQGPIAFTGQYAPGLVFDALHEAAGPAPAAPGCADNVNAGHATPNSAQGGQGEDRPVSDKKCADPGPADSARSFARQLGLGVDFTVPALTAQTGKTDPNSEITATPFGMAVAAATIGKGSIPMPMLINGKPGTADQSPTQLAQPALDRMRARMRDSVANGALSQLNQYPGVNALVGEAGNTQNPPSWLIGTRGDLAFAILVTSTDPSDNPVIVANQFLRPNQPG